MKKAAQILSIVMLIAGLSTSTFAGNEKTDKTSKATVSTNISGKIVDLKSGEALAGVKVTLEGTKDVVYTDFDGNFTFNVSPGKYNICADYISYKETTFKDVDAVPGMNQTLKLNLKAVTE